MELDYLPIEKEFIIYRPERFLINLADVELLFEIVWNVEDENFYLNLYDSDGNVILFGKRFVYGQDILADVHHNYLPNSLKIIPLDFSGEYEQITFDNFMESIKPYIFEGG